jgi:hypothetical protein
MAVRVTVAYCQLAVYTYIRAYKVKEDFVVVRHGCLNLMDCFIVADLEINCYAVSCTDGVTRAWRVVVRVILCLVTVISAIVGHPPDVQTDIPRMFSRNLLI